MMATGDAPPNPAERAVDAAAMGTLADVRVGERARVTRIVGQGAVVQRLQEMGLIAGVELSVIRFAPLGDPVEIRVRGYALSLRRTEARCVEVGPVGP
jgi:Fe2+ transport system protein FeoA